MMRLKNPSIGLATVLAGIYLVLALFSVACVFEHVDPKPAAHHHGGTVSHSSFCAWACQVNPTSDAGSLALLLQPFLVATLFVEGDRSVVSHGVGFHAASRAPPVQS